MTSTAEKPKRRDLWFTLFLFAIVLASLIVLALATGWEETLASLAKVGPAQVAILLALAFANYILRAARWHLFTRRLGIPSGLGTDLRHYLGGLAMAVTPGRVGELVRLRWLRQETGWTLERTAPLALVDRASDLAAIGLLLAASLAFGGSGGGAGIPVAVVAVIVALVVTRSSLAVWGVTTSWKLVGRWPRLFGKLRQAARALAPFSEPAVLFPALVLGGLGWLAEGYSFHLLMVWLGADIGLWTAVAIFVIATLGGGATGAPGGLGGAEVAMVALLSVQGVPLDVSIPATAIIRLTTLWFAIAIGTGVFPFATRSAARGAHAC